MNKDVFVQTWPCSYYQGSDRRWLPGRLFLTPSHLRFREDNEDTFLLDVHLSSISGIKKESSSYIFSSITVLEKDNTKHWFSSFQTNRSAILTVLEHFWKEQLLSPQGEEDEPRTSKGKELITIAAESQRMLEDTGRALHHQGEQFDHMIKDLNKIEAEMSTADRMLSVLEAPVWWPFSGNPWKRLSGRRLPVPKESSPIDRHQGKEGVIMTIPIVFSRHPDHHLKAGQLTILLSALEIEDSNARLYHRYERQDVDEIRAITGHEMTVRQRFIGKPDIAYRILSARLPEALSLLEMQYGRKMDFLEEAATYSDKWRNPPSNRLSPAGQTDPWDLDTIVSSRPGSGGQAEAMTENQEVLESEAQELRKILVKLKCIALDAESELDRQDEALEQVASSVDRSVFNMDKQIRRMKKLL